LQVDLSILDYLVITGNYYFDLFITIVIPWMLYFNEKRKWAKFLTYMYGRINAIFNIKKNRKK
jgi:hypothetical protein